jgi:hypothetical protein
VIGSSRGAALPRRMLIVAVAVLIPVLAGCEAGDGAPTLQWHQPTAGASATVGGTAGITVSDVFVLGEPPFGTLPAGGSAGLFFSLVNNGRPDKLISISAPGSAASVTLPGGHIALTSQQAIYPNSPEPKAVLDNLIRPLPGSSSVRVIMNFQNAGSVVLNVPVIPQSQSYSTFSAPPSPTPTPKAGKAKSHPGTTPSPSPSPSSTS